MFTNKKKSNMGKDKLINFEKDDALPLLNWNEIRKHTMPSDCWMVIHGKVYNISPVLSNHPGGSQVLLHYAGRDATYPFDDVGHSMESLIFDMPANSLKGKLESTKTTRIRGYESSSSDSCGNSNDKNGSDNEDGDGEKDEVVVTQSQFQSYVAIWNKIYTLLLYCVILVCAILLTCLRWRNGETQEPANEDIPSWAFS